MNTYTMEKYALNAEQINEFQAELDKLRSEIEAKIGTEDADYIHSVIEIKRYLEVSGRLMIHFSLEPVSWSLGVAALSLSQILENMEIGHNVIHGQYDFMGDPNINSKEYEWTMTGTAKNWKRAHNFHHHKFTNVIGKDNDYGFGLFRFSDEIKWRPIHLLQPVISPISALFFEYAIALYDLQLTQFLLPKSLRQAEAGAMLEPEKVREELLEFLKKSSKKAGMEYAFYPLLAGPLAPKVLLGNVSAQLIRNLWSFAVIYCGHLPDGNEVFTEQEMEAETKGQWYIRQIMGSSNFEGGRIMHILSGHLSHQIEHHLFPDLPAWRYREASVKVKALCDDYGIPYQTEKMVPMLKTVAKRLVKFAAPDNKGLAIKSRLKGWSFLNKRSKLIKESSSQGGQTQVELTTSVPKTTVTQQKDPAYAA